MMLLAQRVISICDQVCVVVIFSEILAFTFLNTFFLVYITVCTNVFIRLASQNVMIISSPSSVNMSD